MPLLGAAFVLPHRIISNQLKRPIQQQVGNVGSPGYLLLYSCGTTNNDAAVGSISNLTTNVSQYRIHISAGDRDVWEMCWSRTAIQGINSTAGIGPSESISNTYQKGYLAARRID